MKASIKNTLLLTLLCLSVLQINAQNFPFPQNRQYKFGLMASNRSAQDARKAYNTWKTNFLTTCGNGRYRVKFDNPAQTVSEGIAYGMLLTAYADDRAIFDGLWRYYRDHANQNGFMNWRIEGCGNASGFNGATDGDLDATMALIVAHYQWGSQGGVNYQNEAKAHIARIKQHEIEASSKVLKPGDVFGGSGLTNPSYFAPGYYRVFGTFTNDQSFWNQVANKAYEVIDKNLQANNAVGGLVSDWCHANGNHSSQAGGYFNGGRRYHYDAARTPWRIATDYIWFGNSQAAAYCKKSSDFVRVSLNGSKNVKDGYFQNGNVYGQYHNSTFVGAFANAAMAGQNQAHLNSSYADLVSINDDNSYFNQSLKVLYLFQLTGNFFLPIEGGTSPQQIIANGTYFIASPANGQRMTAKASESHNARMVNSGNFSDQIWLFKHLGNDVYTIQNQASKRYLEVPFAKCAPNKVSNVATWTNASDNHKRWKIIKNGNRYELRPVHCAQQALDRHFGRQDANVQIYPAGNNPNQQWLLVAESNARTTYTQIPLPETTKAYPNPVQDRLSIRGASGIGFIYGFEGRRVMRVHITSQNNSIDVSSLPSGYYTLILDQKYIFKFIKQ